MTKREQWNDLIAKWKKLVEGLRELFDAIVATFDMLGAIISETYDKVRYAMYKQRRHIRKAYRRKRKGRW